DVVVVGGTEACLHPLPLAAFAAMMALSKRNDEPERASRPYDKGRDGFVFGEGAGILVLESAEYAAARGARVYATVAGQGLTSDGHHIAQPDPYGPGALRAIQFALADPDDDVHLDVVSGSPRQLPEGAIAGLNNSFGFGGHNAALVFRSAS